MKKMTTVFVVTYEVKGKGVISNEVRDVNRWVLDGKGVATIKFSAFVLGLPNKMLKKFIQIENGSQLQFKLYITLL